MKKHSLLGAIAFLLLNSLSAFAQPPQGRSFSQSGMIPKGALYGKVLDEEGRGVGFATVQIIGKNAQTQQDSLFAGQLTEPNGDFRIENVPALGELTIVISFLGYAEIKQPIEFKRTPGVRMMGPLEKDLGNFQFSSETTVLDEVVVKGQATVAALSLDRKSFRIDKDLTTAGGTAQDALKNVPSVSVDLDGNVSLRNGAPQVFVDGRPTTLSLDQIAADAIESIEVITNPSAKYDAGGGAAGIINIVLKKEKRIGYNGNLRLGTDSRGGLNSGGDINARGEKINVFASAMYNQFRGFGEGETFRENLFTDPLSNLLQLSENNMRGGFANARAGVDFFLDNRNTLTFSGSMVRGKFDPNSTILNTTDYLSPTGGLLYSSSFDRVSEQNREFRNRGITGQFKHLFPKEGSEWTADINYNQVNFDGDSQFSSIYENGTATNERQVNLGQGSFFTAQTDFIYVVGKDLKLEGGLKTILRNNNNNNSNTYLDPNTNEWVARTQLSDEFEFDDRVFAAYVQAGKSFGDWGLQVGLRAESSDFTGRLIAIDSSFNISYPISLFPSFFATRQLNETDQIQVAYTRRINRPNFFQTLPFTDFSDSLNLRRGNPALLPEFTNSMEISYQKIFEKGHNLLVSVYYKQANNLIASYQFAEPSVNNDKQVIINSYANSNSAAAYGAEVTLKNSYGGWLDITTNVNLFQAKVDASNVEQDLEISRLSGFLKETVQITLPKNFSFQLNGEYRTRASFTPSSNNGMFGRGSSQNTAQGYTKDLWFVDASVRKSLANNKAFLTVSVQDVFKSRKFGSYTSSEFFIQDSYRLMNPQLVRVNLSYRFGKMDASLFKRKNNRVNMEGSDMMGG
jgi:outer membrane receptor protein involved in Fe transport